jgi:hypothetical protein
MDYQCRMIGKLNLSFNQEGLPMTTQANHTPEPWSDMNHGISGYYIHSELGKEYAPIANFRRPEDRRRANACVNACTGIPTEALEAEVIQELIGWVKANKPIWSGLKEILAKLGQAGD